MRGAILYAPGDVRYEERPDPMIIEPTDAIVREAIKANQAVIDLLALIGEQKQATPAQVALAWLLAQKPWIVPIPGSRKIERLEENIGAIHVDLTEGDLREIYSAISNITVLGDRY